MPGVRGLDHTAFTVSSLDRALLFYRDLLGCELLSTGEQQGGWLPEMVGYPDAHIKLAFLRAPSGGHLIELIEYVDPPSLSVAIEPWHVGAAHLCFVVDDLDGEYERLRAAGVDSFFSPPVEGEDAEGERWSALYLRDPDGIIVELYRPARPT